MNDYRDNWQGTRTHTTAAPGTTATLLLAANADRRSATLFNAGSATVFLGPVGVTTATGIPLAAGQPLVDAASTGAWYGVVATGAGDVRVVEVV